MLNSAYETMYNVWLTRTDVLQTLDRVQDGEPITAYVYEPANRRDMPEGWARWNGWTVRTWLGVQLGHVVSCTRIPSRWQGSRWIPTMYALTFNVGGRLYYGRSQGPGMYINLRPAKRTYRKAG